jgi:hypothetical protein
MTDLKPGVKQYWARLFSVARNFDYEGYKGLALKINGRICERLGVWTINEATEEQLDQAHRMTNDLVGNKLVVKKGK